MAHDLQGAAGLGEFGGEEDIVGLGDGADLSPMRLRSSSTNVHRWKFRHATVTNAAMPVL